jgi:type I restriction enzyme S subunit
MTGWEQVRLGNVFNLEKGQLQSTKCIPGEYTFITAASDWKTHNEYTHDCEAIIYAVAASGSLGRAHYFQGKFIASDLCFILSERDPKNYPVNFKFYQHVFSFLRSDIVKATKAGTSKESISQKRLAEYRIPYIDIEHQETWIDRLTELLRINNEFAEKQDEQSSHISHLRQSILQEAIEGKLTAAWRAKHPYKKGDPERDGAALLGRIKEEKKRLVAEGKLRKEKPVAPIAAGEEPFALPVGWVWCRLGQVGSFERGKSKHRPRNDPRLFQNGSIPFIQTGEVAQSKYSEFRILSSGKYYNESGLAQSRLWPKGTLCITIAANIAETGFLAIDACFPDSVVGFISLTGNATSWLIRYFLSSVQDEIKRYAPATAQKNINLDIINDLLFPLPPLAEQAAIVERVEKLLATVGELEREVASRKELAAELMREVLREAFEG